MLLFLLDCTVATYVNGGVFFARGSAAALLPGGLGLPATRCRAARCSAAIPKVPSPCPRRQLLGYVAHVGGGGGSGTSAYARDPASDGPWQLVGRIAAGSANGADDGIEALLSAADAQRRLITEHACRLYPPLRAAKRNMQLGVEVPGSAFVLAVEPGWRGRVQARC